MVSDLRMLTPSPLCQLSNRFTSQAFDAFYSIFCQSIRYLIGTNQAIRDDAAIALPQSDRKQLFSIH
ncbi:MAG: hypothetical protein AAGE84_31735 [Cyanobacteria bacterium P01_G01_bin.39]